MRRLVHLGFGLFGLWIASSSGLSAPGRDVLAQEGVTAACHAEFEQAQVDFMAHCFERPAGTACLASQGGAIEMASGQVITGAGQAAQLTGVARLTLTADAGWSLAALSMPDRLATDKAVTLILLGPVELAFDQTARQPGTEFSLTSPQAGAACEGLPQPGVLVQSPAATLTLLRVNGVQVTVNGTALLQPLADGGLRVSALTRESILGHSDVLFAGFGAAITAEGVSPVLPYDAGAVANLPVAILPDITPIALPGHATVREAVNVFSRPAREAYTHQTVETGLPVSVFGRSSDHQWLHIRTYDGVIGWIPASNLDVSVPGELPVYDQAPPRPIRPFGGVQATIVTRWEHNNLRAGPGEAHEIVVSVPLWTELRLYGRSPDDQWLLVETAEGDRGWVSTSLISPSTPYNLEELPYPPDVGG